MKEVRCPHCKELFFKANMADLEIMSKCGRLVRVKFFTAKALLLTSESKKDMLKVSKQSTEVIEPDSKAKP